MKIVKREFLVAIKLPQDYGSVNISNGFTAELNEDESELFESEKSKIISETIDEVKRLKNTVAVEKDNKISLKL